MRIFKYPLWQYPHFWWWLLKQAVHRHVWKVVCPLERRQRGPDGQWSIVVARGAIERCSCDKQREVWEPSSDSDGPRMAETNEDSAWGEAGPARAEGIARDKQP